MSLSNPFKRVTMAGLTAILLAGCTLQPAYQSTSMGKKNFDLTYANADTRLEQVIFQKIRFALGQKTNATYKLDLSASTSTRALYIAGSQFARNESEMKVTISYQLFRQEDENGEEKEELAGTRFATAIYQTSGQLVDDKSAKQDAEHRAGEAAAKLVEIDLLQFFNQASAQ